MHILESGSVALGNTARNSGIKKCVEKREGKSKCSQREIHFRRRKSRKKQVRCSLMSF